MCRAGYVAHLGEKPKSYRFLFLNNPEVKDHLRKLGQSGRIILKWINMYGMH
jgi:hypothetical protein